MRSVGDTFPSAVTNIPIGCKAVRLHFLHGTGWTEANGVQIGSYLLNYVDGKGKHYRLSTQCIFITGGPWHPEIPTPQRPTALWFGKGRMTPSERGTDTCAST